MFFNKPYYLGGEVIVGRVDLNLTAPVQAKELKIKWKGYEKTYIENTIRVDNHTGAYGSPVVYNPAPHVNVGAGIPGRGPGYRTEIYKDEKTFFKSVSTLAAINGGILAPGTWSWNFQFQLPPNLPSVFYDKHVEFDGDKIKAGVVYECKVWVDMPGSDMKAKEAVIISELLSQRVMPVADKKIKSFAFAKGKLEFSADIGKDVFCPGEVVPIQVKIVNPSGKKVNAVKVRLVMHVKVRAHGFVKSFTKRVSNVSFPGTDKGSNMDVVLTVQLPTDVYPTTNGNLVQCHYELVVECDLPMAFDLQISPKVLIALLPAPDTSYAMMAAYSGGGWKTF